MYAKNMIVGIFQTRFDVSSGLILPFDNTKKEILADARLENLGLYMLEISDADPVFKEQMHTGCREEKDEEK